MKDRDKKRFASTLTWFNQFFDGLHQIYQHTLTLLPVELLADGFTSNIENFYYPSLKAAPSLPPYYALMVPGRQAAYQVLSVVDAGLFHPGGMFSAEPSMLVVVHSLPEKYAWVDEFALKVIKTQDTEQVRKAGDTVWGKIAGRYPADFFAFQVQYDHFSDVRNPLEAVRKWIVDPIIAILEEGFQSSPGTTP